MASDDPQTRNRVSITLCKLFGDPIFTAEKEVGERSIA
jgi:hypothetical protein